MVAKYNLMNLFPTPLYAAELDPNLTDEEVEFVHDPELYKFFPNQNYASKSMNILNHSKMKRIKSIIQLHLDNYAKDIMGIDYKLVHTVSWLNRNPPGTVHVRHRHVNSLVSGVLYFTDPAPIEFHTAKTIVRSDFLVPVSNHNVYNSNSWWVPVEKNNLILFPSYLEHSVFANSKATDRISLSFNSFVKGTVGNIHDCDFIDFEDLEMVSEKYSPTNAS